MTEPSRLQLDLREETWIGPARTAVPWESGIVRQVRAASAPAPAPATLAECGCPADCARDHETD
jgi:hypothetical protein